MSDPRRLLGGGAEPEVTELLESLRGISPEAHLAEQSFAAFAAKLATLPAAVPSLGAPAAEAASKALSLKLTLAVVAAGAVGAFAYGVSVPAKAPVAAPSVTRVRVAAAPTSATPVTAPSIVPEAPLVSPPRATDRPRLRDSATTGESRLEAEAALLSTARKQLRAGDARGALRSISELESSFPRGQLTQEREVLAIEAAAASGNTALAKRKAQAFIQQHPKSPHNARLERFAEAP